MHLPCCDAIVTWWVSPSIEHVACQPGCATARRPRASSRSPSPRSGDCSPTPPRRSRKPKIWTDVDRDYENLRIGMQTLFRHVGIDTLAAAA